MDWCNVLSCIYRTSEGTASKGAIARLADVLAEWCGARGADELADIACIVTRRRERHGTAKCDDQCRAMELHRKKRLARTDR